MAKNLEVTAELLIRANKKGSPITEVAITKANPVWSEAGIGYTILLLGPGF